MMANLSNQTFWPLFFYLITGYIFVSLSLDHPMKYELGIIDNCRTYGGRFYILSWQD